MIFTYLTQMLWFCDQYLHSILRYKCNQSVLVIVSKQINKIEVCCILNISYSSFALENYIIKNIFHVISACYFLTLSRKDVLLPRGHPQCEQKFTGLF